MCRSKTKSRPTYVRKTRDRWDIETNWGSGWEIESSYTVEDYINPKLSAREDAREYAFAGAKVRVIKRRERIA